MTVGAGMAAGLGGVKWRWAVQGDSPSPNPLPLGEGFLVACAPPSFRRRPESRTPVAPAIGGGRGVDSRFRGNDGMGAGMAVGWREWRRERRE